MTGAILVHEDMIRDGLTQAFEMASDAQKAIVAVTTNQNYQELANNLFGPNLEQRVYPQCEGEQSVIHQGKKRGL